MQKKKCSKCKKLKVLSNFNKNNASKSGLQEHCKLCIKKNSQTKEGLITSIYSTQKRNSRTRNHPLPTYDKNTLKEWLLKHPLFDKLFNNWKNSGYATMLRPSVDRKKDDLPYTLGNVQLMTWGNNQYKAYADRRSGKTITNHKSVIQYTEDGVFVAEFASARQAGRMTKMKHQKISLTCRGLYKTAGGFRWKFKEQLKVT